MPHIHIKHCFRHANRCVDRLARMSFSQISNFSLFDSSHVDMIDVIENDLNACISIDYVLNFVVPLSLF